MQQMSPMLQARIAQQQEIKIQQNNNAQQIDLTQKPDIVSFSGKKVARNTGVGAILGVICGGIKQRISAKDKFVEGNELYDKLLTAEKKKIFSSYIDYLKSALQKVKNGVELTIDEKEILNGLNFGPTMKYIPQEKLNLIIDEIIEGLPQATKDGDLHHALFRPFFDVQNKFITLARIKFIEHIEEIGKTGHLPENFDNYTYPDIFNDCSGLRKLLVHVIEQSKATTEDSVIIETMRKYPELIFARTTGSKYNPDTIRELVPAVQENSYLNFSKDKIAQASESIKSQLVNKETLKGAGIGAAIVGGIALIGSLIYKAVTNKKAEQNK